MHEISLAEGVRSIVENAARAHNVGQFKGVVLEIGALSCVDPQALLFALDIVLRKSAAGGAEIIVETIAGKGWCLGCDSTVGLMALSDACPNCGSYRIQPVAGQEMRVKELRLD